MIGSIDGWSVAVSDGPTHWTLWNGAGFCMVAIRIASALLALGVSMAASADAVFGEPLSDAAPVRIAELTADPEAYVGRNVKVVGLVDDICPMKGCWVDILDRQSRETIRLKVQDDVIVFPAEARGREIVAEGMLRRLQLSPTQAVAWLRHAAVERGETFTEPAEPEALTIYQIEGSGAVVSDAGGGPAGSD